MKTGRLLYNIAIALTLSVIRVSAGTVSVTTLPAGVTDTDGSKYVIISSSDAKTTGVNFSCTATPVKGSVTGYKWTFPHGSPLSSTSQNPGTVTFTGIDGQLNSCTVGVNHAGSHGESCASSSTPVSTVKVIVPLITAFLPKDANPNNYSWFRLWYVTGITAGTDVGIQQNQKATLLVAPHKGTFTWSIVSGSDKITITPSSDTYSAIIQSKKASAATQDVEIDLKDNADSKIKAKCWITVYSPKASIQQTDTYTAFTLGALGAVKGYQDEIKLLVTDQLTHAVDGGLYVNESFGSSVSDYTGELWSVASAIHGNGQTNTDGTFLDDYSSPGVGGTLHLPNYPLACWNTDPGASTPVVHSPQTYDAGSTSSAVGQKISTHTGVQMRLGYAQEY